MDPPFVIMWFGGFRLVLFFRERYIPNIFPFFMIYWPVLLTATPLLLSTSFAHLFALSATHLPSSGHLLEKLPFTPYLLSMSRIGGSLPARICR